MIQKAKVNLFQLIQEDLSGKEIIITNEQQPLALPKVSFAT